MKYSELPTLAIVVPCFNESKAFPLCLQELGKVLNQLINQHKISADSYILFSDDHSQDDTWMQIASAAQQNSYVRGIRLSRNKGTQINLIAGLTYAYQNVDITISTDADLQDDPAAIEKMVDAYTAGNEIVYGVRSSRESDGYFKRFTAESFYKIISIMGVEQVFNHSDFRLLSKKALTALFQYQEQNLYIRGLVPLIGFKSTNVYYKRLPRIAGETKYSPRTLLSLALTAITSLSVTPLRVISITGLLMCLFSIAAIFCVIFLKITGKTIAGWPSMVIIIIFCGGGQMLSLGIIGEYIGKIYLEVKNRPKFFIEEVSHYTIIPDQSINIGIYNEE